MALAAASLTVWEMRDMYLHLLDCSKLQDVDIPYLTPVVPNVSRTTPANFHLAFVASSDLVQYGNVSYTTQASLQLRAIRF